MKYILFLLTCVLFSYFSKGQNFPYLNASTGNPDFFVDKDTNMFMVHKNKIAKLDKNYNTIWAKTYSNLDGFDRILLSKTGSMYFIGHAPDQNISFLGKITSTGAIAWVRAASSISFAASGTTLTSYEFILTDVALNSNNQLVVTAQTGGGTPGMSFDCLSMTLDTAGNLAQAKAFRFPISCPGGCGDVVLYLLNESAGIYNYVALGGIYMGGVEPQAGGIQVFKYKPASDSIFDSKLAYIYAGVDIRKSKTRSDVFYITGNNDYQNNIAYAATAKYSLNSLLWSFTCQWNSANVIDEFDEDEKGNVFINMAGYNSPDEEGFIRLDSNGNYNGAVRKYISGISFTTDKVLGRYFRTNVVHYNKYFINALFNNNPSFNTNDSIVHIEPIDSTLNFSCAQSVTPYLTSNNFQNYIPLDPNFKIQSIQISSVNIAPSVFSFPLPASRYIASNYCLFLGIPEKSEEQHIEIFPNPVKDRLTISNIIYNQVSVYNATGILVQVEVNHSELDFSNYPPGVYFLRIKTDKGTIGKKLIKE